MAGTTAFSHPLKCSGGELTVEQPGMPLPKGLYYVPGKVTLNASNIGQATMTIVTGSPLKVNGSVAGVGGPTEGGCAAEQAGENLTVFNPYLGNLLFGNQYFLGAANSKNAEDATTIEGSKSCFKGIIVSTNGRTQLAGEQNSFTCPVMGDRVRLNGSKLYISNECLQAPARHPEGARRRRRDRGKIKAGRRPSSPSRSATTVRRCRASTSTTRFPVTAV